MFTLHGKIVGIIKKTFKSGDRQGQSYPQYQVLSQDGESANLVPVSDYDNRGLKAGEDFKYPVRVRANHFNGKTSLNTVLA